MHLQRLEARGWQISGHNFWYGGSIGSVQPPADASSSQQQAGVPSVSPTSLGLPQKLKRPIATLTARAHPETYAANIRSSRGALQRVLVSPFAHLLAPRFGGNRVCKLRFRSGGRGRSGGRAGAGAKRRTQMQMRRCKMRLVQLLQEQ